MLIFCKPTRLVTRQPRVTGRENPLLVGDRIEIVWSEWPMGGGPETSAEGVMESWVPSFDGGANPSALVRLDSTLPSSGPIPGSQESIDITASYAYLSTRYVGQDWSGANRTVHVVLSEGEMQTDRRNAVWVSAHGVWIKGAGSAPRSAA